MLTMQAFHTFLFGEVGEHSEYFRNLARLAQINLSQVKAFKSDISWSIWNS